MGRYRWSAMASLDPSGALAGSASPGSGEFMRWIRSTLLVLTLWAASASMVGAFGVLSLYVEPGVTEFKYEGFDVRVETTADVIVYLTLEDGEVVGRVDAAPGTRSANVVITVMDDPERIIFEGRVEAPSWFADYLPTETGRGEQ
jgi:hypothetical protein